MSHKVSKAAIDPKGPSHCEEAIATMKDELVVTGAESKFGPPETASAWRETVASLYLPFSYSRTRFNIDQPNDGVKFATTAVPYVGELRPYQLPVYKDATRMLKKHRCGNLSLHCGFGKTTMGIKLWTDFGLKGIALCHRKVLIDQWVESVKKFAPTAKVQIIKSKTVIDPTADFYVINMITVGKRKAKDFESIGFIIVDEAHVCCASKMSRSLTYFCPKYALALTATPQRNDGMDKMLDLYFGTERIVRIAKSPFVVYKYLTGIVPDCKTNERTGKLDWNSVVSSIVGNKKRNKVIVDIVKQFPNKTILLLTKHIAHVNALKKLLDEAGESTTKMCSSETTYDTKARILISTYSKLGVGFDDSRLDMSIWCVSVKEIEQYAGRLRDNGRERIVVDLVDDFSVLHAHWNGRKKWYTSRNGRIIHASKEIGFPATRFSQSVTDHSSETSDDSQPVKPKRLAPRLTDSPASPPPATTKPKRIALRSETPSPPPVDKSIAKNDDSQPAKPKRLAPRLIKT